MKGWTRIIRLGAFAGNEYPDVKARWLDYYGLVVGISGYWVGIFRLMWYRPLVLFYSQDAVIALQ